MFGVSSGILKRFLPSESVCDLKTDFFSSDSFSNELFFYTEHIARDRSFLANLNAPIQKQQSYNIGASGGGHQNIIRFDPFSAKIIRYERKNQYHSAYRANRIQIRRGKQHVFIPSALVSPDKLQKKQERS